MNAIIEPEFFLIQIQYYFLAYNCKALYCKTSERSTKYLCTAPKPNPLTRPLLPPFPLLPAPSSNISFISPLYIPSSLYKVQQELPAIALLKTIGQPGQSVKVLWFVLIFDLQTLLG